VGVIIKETYGVIKFKWQQTSALSKQKKQSAKVILTTLHFLPNLQVGPLSWRTRLVTKCHLCSMRHRDHSIHIERANMHCQGIACTRSFYLYLTSAEGLKLDQFCSKVMAKFYLNQGLYMYIIWSLLYQSMRA
jgi:hypothetical protein